MATLSKREHEIMDAAFRYAKHRQEWQEERGNGSLYLIGDVEMGFLNGANWADLHVWHDAEQEKPEIGEEVVWHVRARTPKGTWLDGYISDRYDGEYEPENAEQWMYIPQPPSRKGAEEWLRKD